MYRNFDSDLFRELYPLYEFEADDACHDLWVKHHRFDLTTCTEEHVIKTMGLALKAYPRGFPWRAYSRLHPEAGRNKWVALEHFLHHGFDHIGVSLSYEEGAGEFLHAVGMFYANRDDRLAIRAFELALGQPDAPSGIKQALAHAYMRHQIWYRSRLLYVEVIDEWISRRDEPSGTGAPDTSVGRSGRMSEESAAVIRGFVETSNRLDCWESYFERLTAIVQMVDRDLQLEICSAFFDRRAGLARQHYLSDAKHLGDEIVAKAVVAVSTFMFCAANHPPRSDGAAEAHVVFLVESLDDEPTRKRLEQHRRALATLGIKEQWFTLGEVDAFCASVANAQAAVLLWVAAWPHVIAALSAARASGCVTFYEIDDLTMDPDHSPPPLALFDGLMGRDVYADLLFGAAMSRGAASLCDYGLAPNESLAERLSAIVERKQCFAIRPAVTPLPELEPVGGRAQDVVTFDVFVRTLRAFIFDQRDPVGAALLTLLETRDDVRIFVSGYLQLGRAFDRFRPKLRRVDINCDHRHVLAACHANVALDEGGERGACRPERSWLEAAQLGVPTVAAATKAYDERLVDGLDVLLVRTPSDWTATLAMLIDDPVRRAAIGAAARARVASTYSDAEALSDYRIAFQVVAAR